MQMQMPLLAGMPPIQLGNMNPTRTKEEGMLRVKSNMNPDWGDFAYKCVVEVAETKKEFTSDDVDDLMESYPLTERPVTHEKRALGVVMTRAAREGVIVSTDRIQPSSRRKLHNSPRRIWLSLIAKPQESVCLI